MVESQRKVTKPELYERLIDRLALALDTARTAGSLRNERPAELELRGLSHAELEVIKAYLDRSERETQLSVLECLRHEVTPHSAKVIWLKDKMTARDTVKVRSLHFK
ncbi:hypothetical protein ACLBNB_28020 [Pseudomonas chlororaphis subsp. aurantiaca]|uniref:hypothetical protein n=1 Tax=Pseudomonas chlororaphis TaxID=587753 RepID=UPI000F560B7B|nr:hypothetical protein [Pseudomonas chlororaphis]AZD57243.1 hypothetical protein C4K19_5491 [Pseudomonas chlororaphis subsp. aurantiaca]AZD63193.1 hypothetical protein C4K18_5255 [Pseudomonas chlororaphis subsp. aurantiaca]